MVYILANGNLSRAVEEWVWYELPFSRALCYRHAYLERQYGYWTVAPEIDEKTAAEIAGQVDRLVSLIQPDVDE